jgi:hypothetical protein
MRRKLQGFIRAFRPVRHHSVCITLSCAVGQCWLPRCSDFKVISKFKEGVDAVAEREFYARLLHERLVIVDSGNFFSGDRWTGD